MRELGLRQEPAYDIAENITAESLHLNSLQQWLIMAEILLPLIQDDGPVMTIMTPTNVPSLSGIVKKSDTCSIRSMRTDREASEAWRLGRWKMGSKSRLR